MTQTNDLSRILFDTPPIIISLVSNFKEPHLQVLSIYVCTQSSSYQAIVVVVLIVVLIDFLRATEKKRVSLHQSSSFHSFSRIGLTDLRSLLFIFDYPSNITDATRFHPSNQYSFCHTLLKHTRETNNTKN